MGKWPLLAYMYPEKLIFFLLIFRFIIKINECCGKRKLEPVVSTWSCKIDLKKRRVYSRMQIVFVSNQEL